MSDDDKNTKEEIYRKFEMVLDSFCNLCNEHTKDHRTNGNEKIDVKYTRGGQDPNVDLSWKILSEYPKSDNEGYESNIHYTCHIHERGIDILFNTEGQKIPMEVSKKIDQSFYEKYISRLITYTAKNSPESEESPKFSIIVTKGMKKNHQEYPIFEHTLYLNRSIALNEDKDKINEQKQDNFNEMVSKLNDKGFYYQDPTNEEGRWWVRFRIQCSIPKEQILKKPTIKEQAQIIFDRADKIIDIYEFFSGRGDSRQLS